MTCWKVTRSNSKHKYLVCTSISPKIATKQHQIIGTCLFSGVAPALVLLPRTPGCSAEA